MLINPDYEIIRKLIRFRVVRQGKELIIVLTLPLIQDESQNDSQRKRQLLELWAQAQAQARKLFL